MFRGFSVASKKSSKKPQRKPTTKKPNLESTRGTELSESFYDKVDNLGIGTSETSDIISTLSSSNSFEYI